MRNVIVRFGCVVLCGIACSILVGCGGGTPDPVAPKTEEGQDLAELCDRIGAQTKDKKRFREYFVEGTAPEDDRRKYNEVMVEMQFGPEDVVINGDSATMNVSILYGDNDEEFFTWEAQKVDGKWKLKSAPLPSAL